MGKAKKPYKAPEEIRRGWDALKREYSITGKPDLSHVTEGVCRVLGLCLDYKPDRQKLVKLIVRLSATEGGEPVTERTARYWINGAWTEDAAAMAVYLSASYLGGRVVRNIEG